MRKPRGGGRPTVYSVAARAGVSAITVSRVLRDPERVSPKLRSRVEDAIKALNYVPNMSARTLASKRTEVVCVLVPSLIYTIFADVLRGIYDAAEKAGLQVQVASTRNSEQEEERLIETLVRQKPAGIIVPGVSQSPRARALLADAGCPVVQMMDMTDDPIDIVVGFSHEAAGRAITAHLLREGYGRIGLVSSRLTPRSEARITGYRATLEPAGCYDPDRIIVSDEATSSLLGRRLLRELLSRKPDTDAVICNADNLAVGALFEAMAQRRRVPEDLGIAAINDSDVLEAAEPSITTIRTRRYEVGFNAVRAIQDRAGGDGYKRVIDLGFEVAQRESTSRRCPAALPPALAERTA